MNKKIFTLLATSLMLFLAVFSVSAQTRWIGDTTLYLPGGMGKGAYHLKVTYIGDRPVGDTLIAMDTRANYANHLRFVDANDLANGDYKDLRAALWCVDVEAPANAGQIPSYKFVNKEYNTPLAVENYGWNGNDYGLSEDTVKLKRIKSQKHGNLTSVLLGGNYMKWAFSYTYNTVQLERHEPLRLEIQGEADYFMTFACNPTTKEIELVKVHINDLDPAADFYKDHLVRFTIMSAAPRLLNAEDFNTRLYEEATQQFTQLSFNPDATEGNVFAQPLWATDANNEYVTLKTKSNQFVTVLDGPSVDNYINKYGIYYPKITTRPTASANGQSEFRFVYYPTEDSLMINVRTINHIAEGYATDDYTRIPAGLLPGGLITHGYDNADILRQLTVRMQDLDAVEGKRVITVLNYPTNAHIHFGIHECTIIGNRTTIPTNLYTIQDQRGRYLIVPLLAGDFTPRWEFLDEIENPLKTPAYQWLVTQVDENSEMSRIHLTNREFDHIRIEYVQVYKTYQPFVGMWHYTDSTLNQKADYTPVNSDGAQVQPSSFKVVLDDPVAADKKKRGLPLTQEDWQKLYRTSPYLGYKYIHKDTLNYFAYSFNYLHYASPDFYIGKQDNNDTLMYVRKDKYYYNLELHDTLRAYGSEKFGIGWTDQLLKHKNTQDVARLERYYYNMQLSDYFDYYSKDNYIVLEKNNSNAFYAYTDEYTAGQSELRKSKFYLRFTYQKDNQEYYTLLDRIDKSDFEYMVKTFGLQITDTLKAYDESHGGITTQAFGVVSASIEDASLVMKARAKTVGTGRHTTFAVSNYHEPLYRRFNTEHEGTNEGDIPEVVKFYEENTNKTRYLYENAHHSVTAQPTGDINYLGIYSKAQNAAEHEANPNIPLHNYAIYVDTAYVNRGTGWIKPQYLLVVGNPIIIDKGGSGCNECGDSIDFRPYVYGRYLINARDSSRKDPSNVAQNSPVRDAKYIWDKDWDRLVFVEAIHMGDTLFILNGNNISNYYSKDKDQKPYLNTRKLIDDPKVGKKHLGDNYHKDVVFSFRLTKKNNPSGPFLIESETTNRSTTMGRMIAPNQGGWVKIQNLVPVISRGSFDDPKLDAQVFDVEPTTEEPLSKEGDLNAAAIQVVSGTESVSILNASGKMVTISNVLGQTIARTLLTSDNATIQAPKGIVVVAIEGENAVKAVVK